MTFQNYVCWKTENIEPILNVEAIQPEEHIFLATHHPLKMKKSESIQGTDEITYTEEDCLRDFLHPEDFAFVPILGQSGTGKSHLIRWLAANIESTPQRKVLLIPKLGTNLKDIIGMILNLPELEEEKFDEYRKRLIQASSSLTEQEARKQLLNQLAIAVGDNGKRDYSQLTDEEQYLLENLDSLLYDPYFRQYWLKNDGIIHRLVIHILGYRNIVENIEERREFTLEDLPLKIEDLPKAGQQAQDFYSFLISDEDIQKATVKWLNQNLDEAITQLLNLGREDLQILMREVRETLAQKNIELVLLIEDFAKLQGIDREVLEAILARPEQVNSKRLCAIRTALACTTGYFNGLIQSFDTVKQRVSFKVNLDLGTVNGQSLITEADIQQMVARYLNAVRHRDSNLKQWFEDYKDNGHNSQPPSFCDECNHRQDCHAGFGETNGIGLYPFTSITLQQMRKRLNPDNFNPRILIKDILKYTLENSVEDIQQGSFPSFKLSQHFQPMALDARIKQDIDQKDTSPQSRERRKILLDLWTQSDKLDKLCDLPLQIHTAFNLSPLGIEVISSPDFSYSKENYSPSPNIVSEAKTDIYSTSKISDKLEEKLAILDNWNNQAILPQEVEKDIREFVYTAVLERIEWDIEMLLRGSFASNSSVFKQRNVLVHSPKVRGKGANYAGIILSLPLNPDDSKEFTETAIAFQGILLYSHYEHWNFKDGERYFRTYAKQLERWSNYIVEQIRCRPRESSVPWNPVPATVELLAISSQLAGFSTHSMEDLINSLFLEIPDLKDSNRSASWQALYKVFQQNRPKLLDILKNYIGCTKGSVKTFQIIDTVQLLKPLKTIRKTWSLHGDIPNDLNKEYEVIHKVRQKADELLIAAIKEEYEQQLNIYKDLASEFGEDVKKKQIVISIKQAIDTAKDAGVFGEKSAANLVEIVVKFNKTKFEGYVDTMKKLQANKDLLNTTPTQLLPSLSEDHQKVMAIAKEFLQQCNTFLDKSLLRVEDDIIKLRSDSDEESIENIHSSIESNLLELQNLLITIREQ